MDEGEEFVRVLAGCEVNELDLVACERTRGVGRGVGRGGGRGVGRGPGGVHVRRPALAVVLLLDQIHIEDPVGGLVAVVVDVQGRGVEVVVVVTARVRCRLVTGHGLIARVPHPVGVEDAERVVGVAVGVGQGHVELDPAHALDQEDARGVVPLDLAPVVRDVGSGGEVGDAVREGARSEVAVVPLLGDHVAEPVAVRRGIEREDPVLAHVDVVGVITRSSLVVDDAVAEVDRHQIVGQAAAARINDSRVKGIDRTEAVADRRGVAVEVGVVADEPFRKEFPGVVEEDPGEALGVGQPDTVGEVGLDQVVVVLGPRLVDPVLLWNRVGAVGGQRLGVAGKGVVGIGHVLHEIPQHGLGDAHARVRVVTAAGDHAEGDDCAVDHARRFGAADHRSRGVDDEEHVRWRRALAQEVLVVGGDPAGQTQGHGQRRPHRDIFLSQAHDILLDSRISNTGPLA